MLMPALPAGQDNNEMKALCFVDDDDEKNQRHFPILCTVYSVQCTVYSVQCTVQNTVKPHKNQHSGNLFQ